MAVRGFSGNRALPPAKSCACFTAPGAAPGGSAQARRRLAVEEQLPASGLLLSGQRMEVVGESARASGDEEQELFHHGRQGAQDARE